MFFIVVSRARARPRSGGLPGSAEQATLRPEYERLPANSDRALISFVR